MRDSMKITIPYQFGSVILTHIAAAAVSFVFQAVVFWFFITRPVIKEIIGIVFTCVYAGMIYHNVNKLSIRDFKDYTPIKPSVFKGIMFGVVLSLITFILFVGWKYVWTNRIVDGSFSGIDSYIINMLFLFWTFPFCGLMNAMGGEINIVGQIVMYAVPIIAATVGYLAGKYNVDALDIIQKIAYEKDTDE